MMAAKLSSWEAKIDVHPS
jgi:hypothetical protein